MFLIEKENVKRIIIDVKRMILFFHAFKYKNNPLEIESDLQVLDLKLALNLGLCQ